MILKPAVETHELPESLDWYRANYDSVKLVYCSKCKKLLALEVAGGHGLALDKRGVAVIPVGSDLLSSRVRLDESEDGPMMGYQCTCGNNTLLSQAEKHHKPDNGWYAPVMPHEEHRIKTEINLCGKHKPDYKRMDNTIMYETFKVEQMK